MTRSISIINYKGGTGKTSTVVNLAHSLSRSGFKVLIVDLDPQGSVSYYLGLTPRKTVYDLLIQQKPYHECATAARENLDVICSNERLYPAELSMATMKNKESLLTQVLQDVTEYDFILLDCAPSMNLLNQNALYFSDEIILPVSMEYLSLVGVKQLLKNIQIMNKMMGKKVAISNVVPTFFDKRNSKSKEILESLNRVFPGKVSSPIHLTVALSEAPGYRQTIFEYEPNSKGARDYDQLTKEVLNYGKA